MRKIIIALIVCFLSAGLAEAQKNYLITKNSVGVVRLGMTVAEARKVLKGYNVERGSDGDGAALIDVDKGGKPIMTLYAGEEDRDAPINENAKIEMIKVWAANYRTADGVHPKMLVKAAERLLGKVKEVFMSEIESREYAVFTKKTKGLLFQIDVSSEGKYMYAGVYPEGKRRGTRCTPLAFIIGIQVSDYFP
jgi:hypothetical protein